MTGSKNILYWDSCIFISWLKNEARPDPQELISIKKYIEKIKSREITIVTSTITQVEVAACNVGKLVLPLFEDLMKRKSIIRIAVDIKVASIARELRDFYKSEPSIQGQINKKPLSVPDSIHLATAIINNVNVFHTFDEKNTNKSLGLIPLNGNVAGHNLLIEKPIIRQLSFDII